MLAADSGMQLQAPSDKGRCWPHREPGCGQDSPAPAPAADRMVVGFGEVLRWLAAFAQLLIPNEKHIDGQIRAPRLVGLGRALGRNQGKQQYMHIRNTDMKVKRLASRTLYFSSRRRFGERP